MDYINIGKIVATFGVKGEVILKHGLDKKLVLKDIAALFVEERKGAYLPYFIQQSKAKDIAESYIKLETIDTKERAQLLTQKQVWLTEEDFRKIADKNSTIGLIGFKVFEENEELGIVEEVIEQPHQVLLRINYHNKEAYIPLHEESLDGIDRKKREIHVSLPDGLLDLYR
jgi:16S rRNA processing protein RimM